MAMTGMSTKKGLDSWLGFEIIVVNSKNLKLFAKSAVRSVHYIQDEPRFRTPGTSGKQPAIRLIRTIR